MVLEGCYACILVTNQTVKDQYNCRPAGHLLTSHPMESLSVCLVLMRVWVVLINSLVQKIPDILLVSCLQRSSYSKLAYNSKGWLLSSDKRCGGVCLRAQASRKAEIWMLCENGSFQSHSFLSSTWRLLSFNSDWIRNSYFLEEERPFFPFKEGPFKANRQHVLKQQANSTQVKCNSNTWPSDHKS